MKKFLLTLLVLCSANSLLHAQKIPLCGTTEVNQKLMEEDPAFKQKRESFELQWQQYNSGLGKRDIVNNDTTYEIPVVIHVIHTGGALGTSYNPADTQLVSWINYLNKVFAAQYAPYPDTNNGGTKFPFRFVLAKRDTNCNATTGIVRVNGSVIPGYATYGVKYSGANGATQANIRGLSHWPEKLYYNIYVVNKFDSIDPYLPFPGGSYLAGFAYYPGAGVVDAAFMLAYVARSGYSTLPHEIGHAMGLAHTFEGGDTSICPTNSNCVTDGDKVCDTEPVKNLLFVSPCATNSQTNSCTGLNYNNTQKNIMGYGGCLDRFTPGQRSRSVLQLISLRAGLASSVTSLAPGIPVKAATCIPTIVNSTNNFGMGPCDVTLNTISYNSGGYNIDDNKVYINNSCALQTVLHPATTYTLTVTTQVNAQKVRAYIDYNNNGVFETPELILDHVGTLANETHTSTFVPAAGAVVDTPLRMRVVSDWAGTSAPAPCGALTYGQAEDFGVFVSTSNLLPVKLTTFYAEVLKKEMVVRLTWQTVSEIKHDHFELERRIDGEHFVKIADQKGSGNSGSYTYSDKNVTNGFTYYYRLRSVDTDGKSVYTQTVTAQLNDPSQTQLQVYPNPVSDKLNYSLDAPVSSAELTLFDISGKVMLKQTVYSSQGILDISKLPQGNYLLQIRSGDTLIASQKIRVQR